MDIVAESLSTNLLRAQNVTVRGQDVLAWFESKLSASVNFAGVFKNLDDAPRKHGAVAIVGSKDYVYSDPPGEWKEFGDEGQIGVLTQAMQMLSNELSCYAKKDEISSVSAVSQLSNDVGYISAESDPVFRSLSSLFLTAHQSLSGYQPVGDYATRDELPRMVSELSNDVGYALGDDVTAALSTLRLEFLDAVSSTVSTVYSYGKDEIYGD